MLEIFKLIEGYPDYAISNFGRVYSLKTNKYLKQSINSAGYMRVWIGDKMIHRLVASHFIPNPLHLPIVDHIDGDKSNNQLNNLRWVNISMNSHNINNKLHNNNKLKIKNICYCNGRGEKRYSFKKVIRGVKYEKRFKTLEEAIEYKHNFMIQ